MAQVQKIALSGSRDIPFNKLLLSQANVRRVKSGVSVEELAEDIARRTLLQSITVRAVLDGEGAETGMFEIPAGGRRYRALELLVKQKRLSRTAPVPCVVRTSGLAEEDSLAENVQRAPLHPLDQFRAFQAMHDKGMPEEEIAAAFFVSPGIVKQRLRLASVAPVLLDVYAEDGMTLDQLMAFTVNPDHERQAQVWEVLQRSYTKQPYEIRRMLTDGAVRASDKRVQFVGVEAYVGAGGAVMRDLFQTDDGGWLDDPRLLDRLVEERLGDAVAKFKAEGWKWIEVGVDLPYGHTYDLRRLHGEQPALSPEEEAARAALQAEFDALDATWGHADELSDEADQRFSELETAIAAIDDRPIRFEPDDIARAGAFVSIDGSGTLRIERGYVRPEDEPPAVEVQTADTPSHEQSPVGDDASATNGPAAEPVEEDGIKPLPDRLMTELTAYRTLALRKAVGGDPGTAFLIALHALCLRLFYRYAQDSCLELDIKTVAFGAQVPGLNDTPVAQAVDRRHDDWGARLPKEPEALWEALTAFDGDSQLALFAHCVSFGINAVYEPYNRRPRALAHADRIAQDVRLDIVQTGWRPTAGNYFARVTKARIVEAVREAKGDTAATMLGSLKKTEMAEQAELLLTGSGWLPEPLRTPGVETLNVADPEPTADQQEAGATVAERSASDTRSIDGADDDVAEAVGDDIEPLTPLPSAIAAE